VVAIVLGYEHGNCKGYNNEEVMICRPRGHHNVLWAFAVAAGLVCAINLAISFTSAASSADADSQQAELNEYLVARGAFEDSTRSYWAQVTSKGKTRLAKRNQGEKISLDDYVLEPPPVYRGPARPKGPTEMPAELFPSQPFPVMADLLKAAREKFNFIPDLPPHEIDYKRAYAKAALAAGLTREQLLAVYILETGGTSGYDTQAGLESKNPTAKAVSTALGYNQLLDGNSVELLDEHGEQFVAILTNSASKRGGALRRRIERKLPALRKMIAFAKLVPKNWSDHDRWIGHRTLALTQEGKAIHALNLDLDIGPLLQIQKLVDSVNFGKRNGFSRQMTGAELELLNLMGDPRGFDAITTPPDLQAKVPTWNFFDAPGYEANAIVRGKTVAQLLSAIEDRVREGSDLPGAQELREALISAQ
jgi:hypothetical protein